MYILFFKSDQTDQIILLGVFSSRSLAQSYIDTCRVHAMETGPQSTTKCDNYFIHFSPLDVPKSFIIQKGKG